MKIEYAMHVCLIALFLSMNPVNTPPLKAQNFVSGSQNPSSGLSGSDLKAEDVVVKSDAVFIGNITGVVAGASAKEQGVTTFVVSVGVTECLRGDVAGQLTASLKVFMGYRQKPPESGNSYIFFVRKNGSEFAVLKLLPATDANIAKVKALIAAAPAPK